ncbi:hypothetical protein DPMN_034307 [Dreissena polymorpha]|uniref:Uncharacterized protein n=1 Tax=Dreissena polymorpha TaxID=45954 RepID=A0A9D4M7B8_DREPO|nr:hypothetical protein DPMN_034307 [Dreissena polymorpha]
MHTLKLFSWSSDAVEITDTDLRWRRSSHAAITAILPSSRARQSDFGLALTRSLENQDRRKSIATRRKSIAVLRGS